MFWTYFMFVLLRPRNKWSGTKQIKSRSLHQYLWNSEVDTTWSVDPIRHLVNSNYEVTLDSIFRPFLKLAKTRRENRFQRKAVKRRNLKACFCNLMGKLVKNVLKLNRIMEFPCRFKKLKTLSRGYLSYC